MLTKEEYKKYFVDNGIRTTPKEKKIKIAIALKGKDKKYWDKMTSRQLSGMLK